jgi:hypothetical protein
MSYNKQFHNPFPYAIIKDDLQEDDVINEVEVEIKVEYIRNNYLHVEAESSLSKTP